MLHKDTIIIIYMASIYFGRKSNNYDNQGRIQNFEIRGPKRANEHSDQIVFNSYTHTQQTFHIYI